MKIIRWTRLEYHRDDGLGVRLWKDYVRRRLLRIFGFGTQPRIIWETDAEPISIVGGVKKPKIFGQ